MGDFGLFSFLVIHCSLFGFIAPTKKAIKHLTFKYFGFERA